MPGLALEGVVRVSLMNNVESWLSAKVERNDYTPSLCGGGSGYTISLGMPHACLTKQLGPRCLTSNHLVRPMLANAMEDSLVLLPAALKLV